jgi:predicted dehydrogenase
MALLGTGNIAQRAFVPAVQAVDGVRLVAVLSRDQTRGAAFAQQYGIPKVYDNLDAFTCKGQAITHQWTNPFIAEVADFVQAIRQQREPCATLVDGLRNVYIMETAREGPLQRPL